MSLTDTIGFDDTRQQADPAKQTQLRDYLNLKFACRGLPTVGDEKDSPFLEMGSSMLKNFQERLRLLKDYRCPVDQYVQDWLVGYLGEDAEGVFESGESMLPDPLILERHGLSRELSLPANADRFDSEIVSSYRAWQGVCHNPSKDRRTTKGVFHIAEGGLPIPADKIATPRIAFAHLLKAALKPPGELMVLPYTSREPVPVEMFASVLLRPVVVPEVPGFTSRKSMETRFFAPGSLVSNLDFVESIFGNAGDPFLPENDARLDVEHWSGHTGCVILAPHLCTLKKKDLGLPHRKDASERQIRDGMFWEWEDECYNNGGAFKISARDSHGVCLTLIADNYFGYCKKEVKTQISFAANLYGLAEEEHAGGALVFPSFNLGEDFQLSEYRQEVDQSFREVAENYAELMHLQPEGYGIDKRYADIIYLPENAAINLRKQSIKWKKGADTHSIQLLPRHTYLMPSGYKIEMRKPSETRRWRLVGTNAEGTFCHKPCTVSGGGKSEISKPLQDAMEEGPVIMTDFEKDMEQVESLLKRDYSDRYRQARAEGEPSRSILDPNRSLGSVIRLFSVSEEFSDEYNQFIAAIPRTVREFIFTLKRYYKPSWGDDWRNRFRVDSINGQLGFLLKFRNQSVLTQYLRVGFAKDGSWRMFGLRQDFVPATKLQREDDISASITIPAHTLNPGQMHPELGQPSYKFVDNCEYRLFQRPDDAIHRGYDKKTELEFSQPGNFFSNYEPIDRGRAREMLQDVIRFEQFTEPMQQTIREFAMAEDEASPSYCVSSAHPRVVDGTPTENPRYLQNRPDLENPRAEYLAEIGSRLFRQVPVDQPVLNPVHAVLPGRRNNPADYEAGIRPLAVYGPIHYQELPELFMDFIASLTGKSPSTTGAGSEGALTKGPFNCLPPVIDLNAAILSYIVSDYQGFTTAAGYIGPNCRVDHDISLLVPEVWSRMFIHERKATHLIEQGHLEKIDDFQHNGTVVLASRLGYRITESFVQSYFGRVFNESSSVFTEEMLRPELQSMDDYIDGIDNIVETQKKVAAHYFEDGSVESACPPLKALLHIMVHGNFEGKDINHPECRALFARESVLASDWYRDRLQAKVNTRLKTLRQHVQSLENFLEKVHYASEAKRMRVEKRLANSRKLLKDLAEDPAPYLRKIHGSIGADPMLAPGS